MAPRNSNKNKNKGTNQTTQITQAPLPSTFTQNNIKGATYIPGLYSPGMPSYNAQYGGGGWAALGKGTTADQLKQKLASDFAAGRMVGGYTGGPIDRQNASSIAAMDQFYYGQPNPTNTSRYGTKATPGYQDIDGVTFSPEGLAAAKANNSPFVQGADYNKWAAGMPTTSPIDRGFGNTSSSTSTKTTRKMNDIKSIKGGLKIGGNNILGAGEARKISRATGRTQDQVIAKALGSGFGIGGNLVNQSNRAFRPSMNPLAIDPLADMRGVRAGKGQIYSGSYQLNDQTMPIVQARSGGANPLGVGGGGRRRGAGMAGGGAADMGATASTQQQPMDTMPMTPEEMAAASSDININMPGVGEDLSNWATGFKAKRSRRKMAGREAQGLASQRINPLGAWRFRA